MSGLLRWRVVVPDRGHDLRIGDTIVYDGDAPKGSRVRLERPLSWHEGDLDRRGLRGALVCLDTTVVDARQTLVLQLLKDRDAAEQPSAAA